MDLRNVNQLARFSNGQQARLQMSYPQRAICTGEFVPTILVTIEQQLLRSAVMTLLLAERNLETINYTFQSTVDLLQTIRQLAPDLIIVDQRRIETETIQQVLSSSPECQQINLVEVHLNSNWVGIYTKRVVQIQRTADLMSIINMLCT